MPSSRSATHALAICLSSESLHQPIRQATANELLMISLLLALIFALAVDRMALIWTVFWATVEESLVRAESCSSRKVDVFVAIWIRMRSTIKAMIEWMERKKKWTDGWSTDECQIFVWLAGPVAMPLFQHREPRAARWGMLIWGWDPQSEWMDVSCIM